MLYIIGTPIGNLGDITLRAIDTLKSCDLILCEDTRQTKKLLTHFQIDKPLRSYHQFNEKKQEERIVEELQKGLHIALVSDAGMPLIADPGYTLVQRCRDEQLPITCIPGPSAVITALALSGLNTDHFQFLGFLPKKPGEIKELIAKALSFQGTTIFFETPHRLLKTLGYFPKEAKLVIARELTKIHEEVVHGSPDELKAHFQENILKGEIVLLLENKEEPPPLLDENKLQEVLKEFLTPRDLAKAMGRITGKGKKAFYQNNLIFLA